tara:strand:+ start:300 stop:428 length:129 start_codon:yes stop_codon:yes gene_type:complete
VLKGHSETIKFSGALKAATQKATLAIEGSHVCEAALAMRAFS